MSAVTKWLSVLAFTLICVQVAVAQTGAPNRTTNSSGQSTTASKTGRAVSGGQTDINSADKAALKAAGLDDASAQRVIEGRPYTAKNQLLSRGILTHAQYDKVKLKIIAHRISHAGNPKGH